MSRTSGPPEGGHPVGFETTSLSTDARETGLRAQLSAGQMAMVAVGGSIGTGLLLGSGAAVQIAGPAVVLTYVAGAIIAWTVTMALGEMASVHPAAGSFGVYAELYLNPWAGFVARYGYWFAVVISISAELVAAATYTAFWFPNVPALVWILIYAAVLLAVNLRQVGDYGRFEYWFAMVKVATIVLFIVVGASLLLGGRVDAQYSQSGGFFPNGAWGPLKAISFALFSFLGVEMVAVASGEAQGSREIGRATRIMFTLLTFVYVGAVAILVGVMPWQAAGVRQSPFVTVFEVAGIPAASTLMNAVVLSAALSGANASLYVTSRMLFSLARGGYAPAALGRLTTAGSPRNAIMASATGILIALIAQKLAPEAAYLYIIGCSLFGGVLAWWVALAAHVRFRARLSADEIARLPLRSPGGAMASRLGFVALTAAIASTWWVDQSRITIVSAGPYLLVLTVAYWAFGRRKTAS